MADAYASRKETEDYAHIVRLNQQMVGQAIKMFDSFISDKPIANLLKIEKSDIPEILQKMAASPKNTSVRVGHDLNGSFIGKENEAYSLKLFYKGTQHILTLAVDAQSTELAYARGSEAAVTEMLLQKGKTLAYEKFKEV